MHAVRLRRLAALAIGFYPSDRQRRLRALAAVPVCRVADAPEAERARVIGVGLTWS